MGKRGPSKKPTQLSRLDGNPGQYPLNDDEPRFKKGIPECPDYLIDEARAEWERISIILDGAGLLTIADRTALASYCEAYKLWVDAVKEIAKTGMVLKTDKGFAYQSPWVSIASSLQKQIKGYLGEFGLTPSARVNLKVPQESPKSKYEDLRKEREKIKQDIEAAMKDGKLTKFQP